MDLSNYAVKDFVLNESFQKWTLERDGHAETFWENWLNEHPDKIELIAEAKSIIQSIKETQEKDLLSECDQVWQRIAESIPELDRDAIIK
jgi:transmembrane sensor